MTSRTFLFLALTFAGCTDDVPEHVVSGAVGASVLMDPPPVPAVPDTFVHYRWLQVSVPDGSLVPDNHATTATLTVTPDKRGEYIYDRYLLDRGSWQVTDRYVLTIGAMP